MIPALKTRRNDGIATLCFICFFILLSSTLAGAQSDSSSNQNDQNYYNRFTPSMAIIVVILIAALFIMGFFSIYIRHCSDSPSASVRHLAAVTGRSRRGLRGLDRSVIDSFPTLEYSVVKVHKIGKGALECAVCLNEFEETEKLRLIPKCDHVFHPECIDEWLSSHTTCPVCRANLVPQPGESIHGVPEFNDYLEAQNDDVETQCENPENNDATADVNASSMENSKPEVLNSNNNENSFKRNRTRRFPRSHSTGHSLVQPGQDTERFTLRLPQDVRKKILMNPALNRARSLVILPREGSSRRGYRTGGDGSSRGRSLRRLDRGLMSDRWVFTMAPPFLVRASSIRSPRVANSGVGEGSSLGNTVVPPAAAAAAAKVAQLPV